ncbi:MAG: Lrp/AsnC family transcriptional regulator [Candidatus Peribacteraceae bacterium]|nr:Lrp/AsnC family transcriptional regulator [Candidatus Peribacteraceae bacterium]
MKQKLLALLTKNPRIAIASLAKILGTTAKKVEVEIQKLLKSGEIVGFSTVLNSNGKDGITAMVEVRVTTQRGRGFDEVGERIARFPEVINVFLISGSHDLNLLVRGKSLADVANFVNKKVAVLDNVIGTTTHFLLKKYKEDGLVFGEKSGDKRIKVSA